MKSKVERKKEKKPRSFVPPAEIRLHSPGVSKLLPQLPKLELLLKWHLRNQVTAEKWQQGAQWGALGYFKCNAVADYIEYVLHNIHINRLQAPSVLLPLIFLFLHLRTESEIQLLFIAPCVDCKIGAHEVIRFSQQLSANETGSRQSAWKCVCVWNVCSAFFCFVFIFYCVI